MVTYGYHINMRELEEQRHLINLHVGPPVHYAIITGSLSAGFKIKENLLLYEALTESSLLKDRVKRLITIDPIRRVILITNNWPKALNPHTVYEEIKHSQQVQALQGS